MRLSDNILYDLGLLIIASYKRGNQHLDPIITRRVIAYGFSQNQIERAESVSVWIRGKSIRLSQGFPRGCFFMPVRYIRDVGYVVPAIGRVLLRLKTRDFMLDVDYDIDVDAFREKVSGEHFDKFLIELAELIMEEPSTLREIISDLRSRGDIWRDHIERYNSDLMQPAYIVIAKTEVLFVEDYSSNELLDWSKAPVISKNLVARILQRDPVSVEDRIYAGALRPIRGFICGDALEFIIEILKQLKMS